MLIFFKGHAAADVAKTRAELGPKKARDRSTHHAINIATYLHPPYSSRLRLRNDGLHEVVGINELQQQLIFPINLLTDRHRVRIDASVTAKSRRPRNSLRWRRPYFFRPGSSL
jgi:hypothetical protein